MLLTLNAAYITGFQHFLDIILEPVSSPDQPAFTPYYEHLPLDFPIPLWAQEKLPIISSQLAQEELLRELELRSSELQKGIFPYVSPVELKDNS